MPIKSDHNTPLIDPLHSKSVEMLDFDLTEIIHKDEPKAQDPKMLKDIADEIRDFLKFFTFRVALAEEVSDSNDVLTVFLYR